MKTIRLIVCMAALCSCLMAAAQTPQTSQTPEQIRQEMARIRRTTNWDDPTAAQKANEQIKILADRLSGRPQNHQPGETPKSKVETDIKLNVPATQEAVMAIADRFYKRSYKTLDAVAKSQFDREYKLVEKDGFNAKAIRQLTNMGTMLITFGDDHHLACLYLAAAVKASPTDTLSVNNFGAYLRIVDSTAVALPVLLYANKLYGESPVILTQIGCSYMEMNDFTRAENYLKQAVNIDPGFGEAHTALCDLYLAQHRLEEAILALFAGVKGMGASYAKASMSFAYMQQQAEKADNGNSSAKEDFWNETGKQLNPGDASAPSVARIERLKMPDFGKCPSHADWTDGGGYTVAAKSANDFVYRIKSFSEEMLEARKQTPSLPPNAVLLDYPNERFALDCITGYFSRESKKEADRFNARMDAIRSNIDSEAEQYLNVSEGYANEYRRCLEGCGDNVPCQLECLRKYCSLVCPLANDFNKGLERYFDEYQKAFQETETNQGKIVDDLYAFANPWLAKIESEYWSRIYAYEIQNVALSVIGSTYAAYAQPFLFPAHTICGTDCSIYANPYTVSPQIVEVPTPQEYKCAGDSKLSVGVGPCSIDLDCESIEFGCAAGAAFSVKRNFVNKSTNVFVGAGVKSSAGVLKAEAKFGFTVTSHDRGGTDVGLKSEVGGSGNLGGAEMGKNIEFSLSLMEGSRMEMKNVYGM